MSTSTGANLAAQAHTQRSPRSPPTRPSGNTSTLSPSPKYQAPSRPSSSHSSGTANKPSSSHETNPSAAAMDIDAGAAPKTSSATVKAGSPATTSASAPTTGERSTPSAHQDEGAASAAAPSSQLALLLSSALAESESLRAALQSAERRARRAERVLSALQLPTGSSSAVAAADAGEAASAGPSGVPSEDAAKARENKTAGEEDEDMEKDAQKDKSTTLPEAAVKAILDAEARAERAERQAQDAQTHLHLLLSHYTTFERYLATLELRQADARGAFTRVVHALTEEALALSPSPPPHGTTSTTARTHGMHLPHVPSPYHAHSQPAASPPAGSSMGRLGGGLRNHQVQQQPSSTPFRTNGYPISSVDHGAGVGTFHALPLPPPPSASTAAGAAAHLYNNSSNVASTSNGSLHPTYAHSSQVQILNGTPNGNGAASSSYALVPSKRVHRRGTRVNGALGNGNGAGEEWAGADHDSSMAEGVKRRRIWDGDESPVPSPLAHHQSVHGQQQQLSASGTGHYQQHHNQQPSPPYTHRPVTNSALGARRYEHDTHGEYYRDSVQSGAKGSVAYDPVRGYAPTPEDYARGSRHIRHTNSSQQHLRQTGDRRGRSASRSSADSWSIDEMLLETATDGGGGGNGSAGSGRERYNEDYERYIRGHDRSRGGAGYDARTARGREDSTRADANLGPSVQTYQTHIFAPPVTGAPTKKAKGSLASAASPSAPASFAAVANGSTTVNANAQGGALGEGGRGGVPAAQLVTLGPGGVVVSGGGAATAPPPSALPGGGYPPQNAAGQRICRQCGMPGRYKEGKCVEKWGPGPEGPGTVCDRCRKKMKRVERRGTIDQAASHAVLAQTQNALLQHQQNHQAAQQQQQQQGAAVPATVTTPAMVGPQMHARASHTQTQPYGLAAQQGMARGDTMIIERGREDRDRTQLLSPRPTTLAAGREYTPRGSRGASSRGHSPLGGPSTYHGERAARSQPANAAHLLHAQTGNGSSGGRRPPTPPYINSISTREQQAYGSVAGDNGEDELADGDGDGEGEGELDVDAEIVRALPSGAGRGVGARSPGTSTTASVGSGGSPRMSGAAKSAATLLHVGGGANGRYANGYGSKHASAVHNGNNHHNAHLRYSNTRGGERDRDSMDLDLEDPEADADADADADVDADADADAELLDAVDAATATASSGGGARMKEEDL